MELLEYHNSWVAANSNLKCEQEGNLTEGEKKGLKSLKKSIKDGSIVVLPTDMTGKFALMSMSIYMRAGEEHTKKGEEVGIDEVRGNQRRLNGHVSMLIKIFGIGNN
jgi:hypothetical protein